MKLNVYIAMANKCTQFFVTSYAQLYTKMMQKQFCKSPYLYFVHLCRNNGQNSSNGSVLISQIRLLEEFLAQNCDQEQFLVCWIIIFDRNTKQQILFHNKNVEEYQGRSQLDNSSVFEYIPCELKPEPYRPKIEYTNNQNYNYKYKREQNIINQQKIVKQLSGKQRQKSQIKIKFSSRINLPEARTPMIMEVIPRPASQFIQSKGKITIKNNLKDKSPIKPMQQRQNNQSNYFKSEYREEKYKYTHQRFKQFKS